MKAQNLEKSVKTALLNVSFVTLTLESYSSVRVFDSTVLSFSTQFSDFHKNFMQNQNSISWRGIRHLELSTLGPRQ